MKNLLRSLVPASIAAVCGALLVITPSQLFADGAKPTLNVPVWAGSPPGETAPEKPEKISRNKEGVVISVSDIWKPSLNFYPAPDATNTGAAVVICPGGAYQNLAYDHEGIRIAQWFNSIGVNAVILKYRVPRRPNTVFGELPLKDAQRALSLVRAKAAEWKLDPTRVGIMGFSAGGHLSTITSVAPARTYEPQDDVDTLSCRPDFSILIYPAYMTEKGKDSYGFNKRGSTKIAEDALTPRTTPGPGTPPAICIHSVNDPYTSDGSLLYFRALRREKISAELHIYATGGHGWGMNKKNEPSETWNAAVAAWLKHGGWLKK
jgi:acetyl esterase/lipase